MATGEFPYTESRGRFYPTISIHIKNKDAEEDVDALIDSGAVISTFRADVAERLSIKLEDGERRTSIGICGKVEVFIHEVELKVLGNWFPCKIAFSKDLTAHFNLIGRQGFFDRHFIAFDEKHRKTIITEFE